MKSTTALNSNCFSEPHWKLIAKGFNVAKWYDDGEGQGTGGIVNPTRVSLKVGHRYYRFASSEKPYSAQVGGGWWVEFDTFNTIEKYAKEHSLELAYVARIFLALPIEWTRVDRIVKAWLTEPLDAYAGLGKVAEGSGSKWTPVQYKPATQLYIPGLFENSKKKNLYKKVWNNIEREFTHNRKKMHRHAEA